MNRVTYWVGQRMTEPAIDFSDLARSQGFVTHPMVTDRDSLNKHLAAAIGEVEGGMRAAGRAHCYGMTMQSWIWRG